VYGRENTVLRWLFKLQFGEANMKLKEAVKIACVILSAPITVFAGILLFITIFLSGDEE